MKTRLKTLKWSLGIAPLLISSMNLVHAHPSTDPSVAKESLIIAPTTTLTFKKDLVLLPKKTGSINGKSNFQNVVGIHGGEDIGNDIFRFDPKRGKTMCVLRFDYRQDESVTIPKGSSFYVEKVNDRSIAILQPSLGFPLFLHCWGQDKKSKEILPKDLTQTTLEEGLGSLADVKYPEER